MTHARQPSLGVRLGLQSDSGFLILPGVLEMKVVSPCTPRWRAWTASIATVLATAPSANVHLNIAWLPSDSKIYLAKRAAGKRSAYLSKLTRTAEVRHRTIRCLVSKPDEHCGNLECPRKPTT